MNKRVVKFIGLLERRNTCSKKERKNNPNSEGITATRNLWYPRRCKSDIYLGYIEMRWLEAFAVQFRHRLWVKPQRSENYECKQAFVIPGSGYGIFQFDYA